MNISLTVSHLAGILINKIIATNVLSAYGINSISVDCIMSLIPDF